MGAPPAEPHAQGQPYRTHHCPQNMDNKEASEDTLARRSMVDVNGSTGSVSVTDQLKGIGTSFADGENQYEAHLFGQYLLSCTVQV
jgi:hypothetical protein